MTPQDLSLADIVIVVVIAASVLGGLAQGFLRSFFSLAGLVLGLSIAAWNYKVVADPIRPLVKSEEIAGIIGFVVVAVVVMTIAGILGSLLARTMRGIGLGCLDRIAGGVFGFFQGFLLVTLGILVTVAFYPQARWLTEARLPRRFFAACHFSTSLSPTQLADRVRADLKLLEGETPGWMHPGDARP